MNNFTSKRVLTSQRKTNKKPKEANKTPTKNYLCYPLTHTCGIKFGKAFEHSSKHSKHRMKQTRIPSSPSSGLNPNYLEESNNHRLWFPVLQSLTKNINPLPAWLSNKSSEHTFWIQTSTILRCSIWSSSELYLHLRFVLGGP